MKFFSKKPEKQRRFAKQLPLHLRKKHCGCHLSRELRKEIGKRAITARSGDRVKITKGKQKGKEGKIMRVDYAKGIVFVEKIARKKADGTEILLPIRASNALIMELERSDERRFGKAKKAEKKTIASGQKQKEKDDIWVEEKKGEK